MTARSDNHFWNISEHLFSFSNTGYRSYGHCFRFARFRGVFLLLWLLLLVSYLSTPDSSALDYRFRDNKETSQ